jgi:hypothetical protein
MSRELDALRESAELALAAKEKCDQRALTRRQAEDALLVARAEEAHAAEQLAAARADLETCFAALLASLSGPGAAGVERPVPGGESHDE